MNDVVATFFLVFCRVSSFIAISPGFSMKQMPNSVKVLLSLSFSISVYATLPEKVVLGNIIIYVLLVIKEVLIGLSLGFIIQLIFSSIEMAGQIVDFQVGFSMGAMFDPGIGIQGSNYGRVYYWLALSLFFLTDMHHVVIDNLINSFALVPLNKGIIGGQTIDGIMLLFVEVFKISILLAAPLVLVALVTDCVLGIISRSVPQINVLMLGMPMKILISFFFMLLFIPNLVDSVIKVLPNINQYMDEFIRSLVR